MKLSDAVKKPAVEEPTVEQRLVILESATLAFQACLLGFLASYAYNSPAWGEAALEQIQSALSQRNSADAHDIGG